MSKSNHTKKTTRKVKASRASAGSKPAAKRKAPKSSGSARAGSKLEQMVTMLRRPVGATIEQMVAATGWQSHSVRGAISGALKKKQGLVVKSEKTDGVRVYRIVGA
jgi:Protein of unknown function (DUF3489)